MKFFLIASALCLASLFGGELLSIVKELPPSQWKQEVQNIDEAVVKLTTFAIKNLQEQHGHKIKAIVFSFNLIIF